MIEGKNIIGFETLSNGNNTVQAFSTITRDLLPEQFHIASDDEISLAIEKATIAFNVYSKTDYLTRALFLEAIAEQILLIGDILLERAHLESGLPLARLTGERDRTMNQLKLFASLLREGSWSDAVIDTALPDRKPMPRTDLRRILQPLGPVVVFGASNFPFAFSTAGGDTASALAAGCSVIVKAHTSHLGTNELISKAVQKAAQQTGMPDGVFSSLIGEGSKLGQRLTVDESIKAVGFTGSYRAGMSIYAAATQKRKTPIPVYAEMSSINPLVLLPNILAEQSAATATTLAGSITLGVGQFCTNPGLIFVMQSEATELFITELVAALSASVPGVMLNQTICNAYYSERKKISGLPNISTLLEGSDETINYKGSPALYKVSAAHFINEPVLQEEIFGPASLIVVCNDKKELELAINSLRGQLTGSIFGTKADLDEAQPIANMLQQKVGRLIFNAVPTGVEVCHAMVHGGPFPSTSDSRTTSVGTEAIRRFVRPVCYQDAPSALLPIYLRNENEASIMRKVNGVLTRDAIV